MQFNEQLIEVLKNFSTINPSIVFSPGDRIATMSPMKTILAKARTDVEIPREFAIYDLSRLIQVLSLYENAEIECQDNHLLISGGGESIQFFYCAPNLVATPPGKLELPSVDVEFKLNDATLSRALKVAGTLSSPEIALIGDGSKVVLKAFNSSNASDNNWRVEVGETTKNFTLVFLLENIKLLPRDYNVLVSAKGLSKFVADDIEYFVAIEAKSSKFE